MKKLIATKAIILVAVLAVIALSSCSRKGYGCRGNESWKHLERRINNGY